MTVILLVALAVCALGWLNRYVCCMAILLYVQKKYDTLPSDEDLKACLDEAWLRVLHIK